MHGELAGIRPTVMPNPLGGHVKRIMIALGAALLLTLTACASGGTVSGQPSTGPMNTATPAPTASGGITPPPVPSGDPVDVPTARWDAIVADLTTRGVSGTPTLVSSEAVMWPDGSLGCPQPGMSYTQAVVEGMRVVVTADGKQYDYRFGASGDSPKLCESGMSR